MLGVTAVVLSIIASLVAALMHLISYGHHRKQALRFWERELKLPDATRYDNLLLRIEEAQSELDRFQDQLFDARQIIDEAERQRRWIDETKEEVAKLELERNELLRLQNELESLQTQLAELSQLRLDFETRIEELKSKYKEVEGLHSRLQAEIVELEGKQRQAAAIEEALKQLKIDQQEEESKLEKLRNRAVEIRNELQHEIQELKKQRDSNKKEVDDLAEQIKSLSAKETQLRNEVSGLEAKSNALNNQIPVLQSAFDSLSEHVNPGFNSEDTKKSDIWQPVLIANSSLTPPISELDALANLRRQLEQLGLKFHKRTIDAFHTALKTMESSPLVVLAGVSGTGKSELPRRYAEAMGFHFLNMAVQPRWDSPQDLFGFYDYLERKFRPTELTRALIQMDEFRNKGERGWRPPIEFAQSSCSNGLLLVLLDEMNLARVEYYFSEFLSRLETRRGINIQDDQQRKRAEIVLEVAGRQSGEPPMQLFVGKNVFFVGTMNEDETTQSLSDKVIDRANVLRFGSPNSVNSVYERPISNGKPIVTNTLLSREQWISWQKGICDLGDQEKSRMLDWISQLRTVLDGVRRPFAYRVAQSMLEYAANYPDVEEKLNISIADQIEQKVLPRLRGLDPFDRESQKLFDAIHRILDEVGDDALSAQIKDCCRDHYFQWIGLDRYEVEPSTK